ncbi:unnamed protein product, partial [marine sediment metagenome]
LEPSLNRAERTPEVAAVSGICRERGESLKTLPDFPRTNLNQAIWETILKAPDTGEISIDHDFVNDYLDYVAQLLPDEAKSYLPFLPKKCGQWAKIGQCENGHRFAVKINCRKPWCDVCGDIEWHKTIARLYPKVQQLLPAALLTIRPPNELQVFEMNRYERRRFTKTVIKALKSLGYRRGIIFIHLFGDDSTRYAFHLHILLDGDWLEPEELDELCRKLRRKIYRRWVIRKWGDSLIVNYRYKPTQAQVYQALEYCTRPTFTQLAGNEWLDDSIRGERKVRSWGKWDEAPKWHLDDTGKKLQSLVSLEKGKCPECGSPITWGKPLVPLAQALAQGGTEITAGYYALSPIRDPPTAPVRPTNLIELPDDDYRKHPNTVRRLVDRARERISFISDYESCS